MLFFFFLERLNSRIQLFNACLLQNPTEIQAKKNEPEEVGFTRPQCCD